MVQVWKDLRENVDAKVKTCVNMQKSLSLRWFLSRSGSRSWSRYVSAATAAVRQVEARASLAHKAFTHCNDGHDTMKRLSRLSRQAEMYASTVKS